MGDAIAGSQRIYTFVQFVSCILSQLGQDFSQELTGSSGISPAGLRDRMSVELMKKLRALRLYNQEKAHLFYSSPGQIKLYLIAW